jgi:hypothetical protein
VCKRSSTCRATMTPNASEVNRLTADAVKSRLARAEAGVCAACVCVRVWGVFVRQ